jgi:hypothetical protein
VVLKRSRLISSLQGSTGIRSRPLRLEMNSLNVFPLGRAIASRTETGIFVLPKGPSGKVKLAPKTGKPVAAKEV